MKLELTIEEVQALKETLSDIIEVYDESDDEFTQALVPCLQSIKSKLEG